MSGEIGFLIGMAAGQAQENANGHASDIGLMRLELASKLADVAYHAAFKEAAAAVQDEMIAELRGDSKGKTARRLSDPANVDGRNLAFAENAATAVRRISSGRITMSLDEVKHMSKRNMLK